jgi:lysozyme family protein
VKSNYNFCLNQVLKSEGGYTNDPNDAGGPTNFGITIADYKKYINKKGTAKDVRGMSLDDAKSIYKSKYWDVIDADNLPSGVDYTCFDYAVNSGVGRIPRVLKQFKDKSGVDLINAINDERIHFLHNIRGGSDWIHFGRGWNDRVSRVRKDSINLATSKTPSVGGAVVTSVAAGGASIWQWGLHHWMLLSASAAFLGLLSYLLIHTIRKKNNVN